MNKEKKMLQIMIELPEDDYKEIVETSYIRDGKQYGNILKALKNAILLNTLTNNDTEQK